MISRFFYILWVGAIFFLLFLYRIYYRDVWIFFFINSHVIFTYLLIKSRMLKQRLNHISTVHERFLNVHGRTSSSLHYTKDG